MIIVPTEKRFEWQNAPIALFVIVILNVLVFYSYQTGDTNHLEDAINIYVSDGIYAKEVPIYRDFLKQNHTNEDLELFNEVARYPRPEFAAAYILQDETFYTHMIENGAKYFDADYHEYWLFQRLHIHDLMYEVSYHKLGLTANNIQVTTLITHQFLHGSTMHLIGNMFFLIICGFAVEASVGHRNFLFFYLLTGIGGGLAQAFMDLQSTTPLIGASGAVSGVMAMYLGLFRLRKIEFFYWFFVFVGYFRAPALFILPFYIGKELISLWSESGSNVAFMAHVGGFVTGTAIIALVLWRKPDIVDHDYIETDQSAPPKQLSLDKIYQSMEKFQFESAAEQLDQHMAEFGSMFNLKVLKYKLLHALKSEGGSTEAQDYFNQIINHTRFNKRQLAKIEKIWRAMPKNNKKLDQEAQYKLAWNFITVPEHIDHAIHLFQQMYQAPIKHSSLNVLAKKISLAYKRLENQPEAEKYSAIAEELS